MRIMNWRVVIVAVVSAFVSQEIAAQANILNAKKPEENRVAYRRHKKLLIMINRYLMAM